MKAISLYQPLAGCVAHGYKRLETRSWSTKYRGPLAIHAALKYDHILTHKTTVTLASHEIDWSPSFFSARGALLAVVDLVAIKRVEDVRSHFRTFDEFGKPDGWELEYHLGDYSDGRFAWVFENIRILRWSVACLGRQRLFNLPPKTEQHILEQHLSVVSVPSL